MKKPTYKSKGWNRIHAILSNRQRLTHKNKLQRSKRSTQPKQQTRSALIAKMQRRQSISVPTKMALYTQTVDETIHFTRSIAKSISTESIISLDFSQTQALTAVGAVYLYSEIDVCTQHKQAQTIHISLVGVHHPIRNFLRSTGLLALTNGQPEPTGDMLPILSGQNDDHVDKIVDFLTKRAVFDQELGNINVDEAERLVTIALTEAMLNVMQHAYQEKSSARWWMTAAIIGGELNIALCDRGVGIPETLPNQGWFETLRKRIPINNDAEMIKAAMEYSRTSHPSSQGRCLGSRDIQNLVLQQKRGHLTIISGKGHYRLIGETGKVEINSITEDVRGTVIQWTIPMKTTNQGKI